MTSFRYITVEMGLPIQTVVDFIRDRECNYNKVEESLQIRAVIEYPGCLEWMAKPSKRVQEAAIKHNPVNIGRIRKPTRDMQLLAVSIDPKTIDMIIKPCQEAKSLAAIVS